MAILMDRRMCAGAQLLDVQHSWQRDAGRARWTRKLSE